MILKENLDLTLKWLQLIFVILRDMSRDPRNISHSLFLSRQFCFSRPVRTKFENSEATINLFPHLRYCPSPKECPDHSKFSARNSAHSPSVSHREFVIFIFCLDKLLQNDKGHAAFLRSLIGSQSLHYKIYFSAGKEAVVAHLNNSSKYREFLKTVFSEKEANLFFPYMFHGTANHQSVSFMSYWLYSSK